MKQIKFLIFILALAIFLQTTYADMSVLQFEPADWSYVSTNVLFSVNVVNYSGLSADNATFEMANSTLEFPTCVDLTPEYDNVTNITHFDCTWNTLGSANMLYDNVSVELTNTTHNITEYNFNITVDNILPIPTIISITNNETFNSTMPTNVSFESSDTNLIPNYIIQIVDQATNLSLYNIVDSSENITAPLTFYEEYELWNGTLFTIKSGTTTDIISVIDYRDPPWPDYIFVNGFLNDENFSILYFYRSNLTLAEISGNGSSIESTDYIFKVVNWNIDLDYVNATSFTLESDVRLNIVPANDSTLYQIRYRSLDLVENQNYTDLTDVVIGKIPPVYSNIVAPSNMYYVQGATYNFNSTWIDNGIIDRVIFTFNGFNYTNVSKYDNVYHYNITDLAAGVYNYLWYANDTRNAQNSTSGTFEVLKNISGFGIVSYPTSPVPDGSTVRVDCYRKYSNVDGTLNLHRDYVLRSSAASGNATDTTVVVVGKNQYYNCNITNSINYTNPTGQGVGLTLVATGGGGGGGGTTPTVPPTTAPEFSILDFSENPVSVNVETPKSITFDILNTWDFDIVNVNLSIGAINPKWYTFDPSVVPVVPKGGKTTVTLTFTIPNTTALQTIHVKVSGIGTDPDGTLEKGTFGGDLALEILAVLPVETANTTTTTNNTASPTGGFLGIIGNYGLLVVAIGAIAAILAYRFRNTDKIIKRSDQDIGASTKLSDLKERLKKLRDRFKRKSEKEEETPRIIVAQ